MTTDPDDEFLEPHERRVGRWIALAAVVVAALAAVPSYLALQDGDSPSTTTLPSPGLRVLTPTNNQAVSEVLVVRGTSENLRGRTIWVLVAPRLTNLMFLQSGPANVQADGDWSNSNVHVGQEGEQGDFDILVVVADEEATKVFRDQRAPCEATVNCPGISELPNGAVEYARVVVARK